MRLIDADALIDEYYKNPTYPNLCNAINSAPTIEIVRCKECKHKQQCRKAVEHITHEPTSVTIGYKTVEWCSYGERREP